MKKKKLKRMRAYADVGSHGGIFMFIGGYIGSDYPGLLHVYKNKITKDLIPVIIEYRV